MFCTVEVGCPFLLFFPASQSASPLSPSFFKESFCHLTLSPIDTRRQMRVPSRWRAALDPPFQDISDFVVPFGIHPVATDFSVVGTLIFALPRVHPE